jgi:hypothetical protein
MFFHTPKYMLIVVCILIFYIQVQHWKYHCSWIETNWFVFLSFHIWHNVQITEDAIGNYIFICCFWTVTTVWYLLFLSCSDSVVFVVFELLRQCGICCFWAVTTVWYLLFLSCYDCVVFVVFELLRQCGICCFWAVTTVWYLLFLNCYDSVVFVVFELLRQCGICCFWAVTTVWYLLFFILLAQLRICIFLEF